MVYGVFVYIHENHFKHKFDNVTKRKHQWLAQIHFI